MPVGFGFVSRRSRLPDDAYGERFDGAPALQREHGITLTPLPQFIEKRVAQWRQAGRA